ncbi:MAG: GNAT family N-acetyltransferase [Sphingorhabdus sp.]
MPEFGLETSRLFLRTWREEDIDPFHLICSDPVVMATLGPPMSREQVVTLIARMQRLHDQLGHCFWAMERKDDHALIGWCGLIRGGENTPIHNKLEIGWRMSPPAWGKGYVTEAASASVQWAFDSLPDEAVWAITSTSNRRSRAVMERLGMIHDQALDFNHPKLSADNPLLSHVTYRMDRALWMQNRQAT